MDGRGDQMPHRPSLSLPIARKENKTHTILISIFAEIRLSGAQEYTFRVMHIQENKLRSYKF